MDDKKLKTVPLNKIKISDQFWNRYIHLVKRCTDSVSVGHFKMTDFRMWRQVIVLKNFKIAAGRN